MYFVFWNLETFHLPTEYDWITHHVVPTHLYGPVGPKLFKLGPCISKGILTVSVL